MVFWPIQSLLVWIEHIWKFFEFGLLLTKVGRDFAHLALQENAPNMMIRLLLLRTMYFLLQARPKRKNSNLYFNANYMMFMKCFFRDCPFFIGSFHSCIFFLRLLNSVSAVGECAERRQAQQEKALNENKRHRRRCIVVQRRPDRMGSLDKPPASSASLPSRASSRMHSCQHSSHPNAGMKQYECGHTQPLL